MNYTKPPLLYAEQLKLLTGRGLIINDVISAELYLQHISYYRLSAYMIPFQGKKDVFNADTTFEKIVDLYVFDRELRLLVLDAIERIEIAVHKSSPPDINDLDYPRKFKIKINKIVVKGGNVKRKIIKELETIGITESTLFPEIEHQAAVVKQMYK